LAALSGVAAGLAWVGGSWLAARRLSHRLISPQGLAPPTSNRQDLLAALRRRTPHVSELRHAGSPLAPDELQATFASPEHPAARPTILFLHGKGGNAAEWQPDALRALSLGYNVLLPDLRGHGESGGTFVTFGLLEKGDLQNAVDAACERFGIPADRLGVHSCSAGSSVALEFAAGRPEVKAVWLESPFADVRGMARHYLAVATGIPAPLLGLVTSFAVATAASRVRRDLGLARSAAGLERLDPLRAVSRVRAPVCLVYGRDDRLIPPRFATRLEQSLPPGSEVWTPAAGHCHHEDEAEKVLPEEYARRWTEFFAKHLPV
jgi:hypothetical protein